MKVTLLKKVLPFILCVVLIAAIALMTTGCNGNENTDVTSQSSALDNVDEVKELGEGATSFFFDVVKPDGEKTSYKIFTDKTTVGDALVELGLISGEDSQYGIYVKCVDGVTLDFDKDGKYWAFYQDSAYANAGVDKTDITSGAKYAFKAES